MMDVLSFALRQKPERQSYIGNYMRGFKRRSGVSKSVQIFATEVAPNIRDKTDVDTCVN